MKPILILLTAAALCCTMIVLCMLKNEPKPTLQDRQLNHMFYSGANASGDMDSCYRAAVKMLPKEDLKPSERNGWWYGRGRNEYNN